MMTQLAPTSMRILVVDDAPSQTMLVKDFLERGGYAVTVAGSGEEALHVLGQVNHPVIITDWKMPGMDGIELCRRIRSHDGIRNSYIVLMTAITSGTDRVIEAFEAGADDFLPKPINPKELIARLRSAKRIISLQNDVERHTLENHRVNAELAVSNDQLLHVNDKLKALASTDVLTGLMNRRAAIEKLHECWLQSEKDNTPLSCIVLDIDHFKRFNDTYGHDGGDRVLKILAQRLQNTDGGVVSRVGGEEFLIILQNMKESAAAAWAEKLRRSIDSHTIQIQQLHIRMSVSMGVSGKSSWMTTPDELMISADMALYTAKETGRNRVCQASRERTNRQSNQIVSPVDSDRVDSALAVRPRIMVVDDDQSIRALCRKILENEGFETDEACDGLEAIDRIKRFMPDAIVLDNEMPNLNGLECTRRLKQNEDTRDIPIMMASADSGLEPIEAGLLAGVYAYVAKPYKRCEFVTQVRNMVAVHRSKKELTYSNRIRGEQARALSILLEFCQGLASSSNLDAVAKTTASITAELTGCRRIAIALAPIGGGDFTVICSLGLDVDDESDLPLISNGSNIADTLARHSTVVLQSKQELEEFGGRDLIGLFTSGPAICKPLITSASHVGVLIASGRPGGGTFSPSELEYLDLVASISAEAIEERLTRKSRDEARDSIVFAMAKLAEYRDSDTGKHLDRVMQFCQLLAKDLRSLPQFKTIISDQFLRDLQRAVPLHDIGKVAVPDHILNKPGRLTDEEMAIMRTHAEIGAATIQSVIERAPDVSFLKMAQQVARAHHEWWNGNGYPENLVGECIPLSARIAALADVYDALTTKRVYKKSMPHEKAKSIILEMRETQFDPAIVDSFVRCQDKFEQLADELGDDLCIKSGADRPSNVDRDEEMQRE